MADRDLYSGRYEILRHLARGGMAEVYLARDHLLDRPVALKVLFPEYARDEAFVERFRREAKSAANLNHPNIVAVYDWGEEEGTYFIVMEYVEGQSLRDLIRDEGTLLPQRAAEVAADIAAALGYAHRHGVVHRDVKPGNVLITPQGQVKVTDFGIARAGASDHLTRTGMVMGTASYFSPEQAQGRAVDPRSDVYSLGIVLYEMVCGEPPFSGDDPVAIAYQQVQENPTPPSERNPDVPADLETVILTALTKAPGDRYPSAEDFRSDLVRYVQGRPIESRAVTAVMADDDATAVSRRVEHTSVAEAVPAGGGPPAAGPPPRPRRRFSPFAITLLILLLLVGGLVFLLVRQLGVGGTERVVVPDVVGKQLEEAKTTLEDDGFKVDPKITPNDTVPENQVFGQDPEGGAKAKKGSTITLQVSKGVGKLQVPDVVDKKAEDARKILTDAGFQVDSKDEFSDQVEQDRVIRTDPEVGTQAPKGSVVTMYVSSGVQPVDVPDVVGQDAVKAAAELAGAGFQVETNRQASDSVPRDTVISTDPAANTQAPKGSTVTMLVSSGPAPATVPNVIGMSKGDADKAIKDAGLKPSSSDTTSCSASQDSKVVSQNPDGGSSASKGSTVSYQVCQFIPGTSGSTTST